ncbi:MAG: hypothetical protein AAB066_04830, partial [Candidatus Margulisiibacteriota bacterium]
NHKRVSTPVSILNSPPPIIAQPVTQLPGYRQVSDDSVREIGERMRDPLMNFDDLAQVELLTADQFLNLVEAANQLPTSTKKTFWVGYLLSHYEATKTQPMWTVSQEKSEQITASVNALRQLPPGDSDLSRQVSAVFATLPFDNQTLRQVGYQVNLAI